MSRNRKPVRPRIRPAVALGCLLVGLLTLVDSQVGTDAGRAAEPMPESETLPLETRRRQPWTTSNFKGSPYPPPPYRTQRAYPKLDFVKPIALTTLPGTERLVVVELGGRVYSFADSADVDQADLMVDLAEHVDKHRRSYGIAFHPRFKENRYVFLCYVLDNGDPLGSRVSRFQVTETDPPQIDPASEQVLIRWHSGGHNGGCLKFGPDGYLYISTGDGQNPHPPDPLRTGQDNSDLLAAILRVDVDRTQDDLPYAIPRDNPFRETAGVRPEIWAYGLRNPWKMCFDPATGELWVGDVGWELWEMIYRVQRAGNYGWSVKEGPQPVNQESPVGPTTISPPVVSHPHTVARSITGGVFYQAQTLPELRGAYIYGDYVTGKLWGLRADGTEVTWNKELADSALDVVAFGNNHSGEALIVAHAGGIYRLAASPINRANDAFPQLLSESGLFESTAQRRLAAGVEPYSINAEPWSDGARAERVIAVPDLARLDRYEKDDRQRGIVAGHWEYPANTVFAKTLSLPLAAAGKAVWRPIETQVLHRDGDTWRAYSYRWNDDATDARLVPEEGADYTYRVANPDSPDDVREQTWRFASRTECIVCHTTRAGSIHGFNRQQLRHLDSQSQDDAADGDPLQRFKQLGYFEKPLMPVEQVLVSPEDESQSLDTRARAYLHVNCAHCHFPGGGGNAPFDLRWSRSLEQTKTVGMRPTQGTFGIHSAAVVAAGAPERSVMLYRMSKLGAGRMPHAGSSRVDIAGARLIHDWIKSLPAESTGEAARTLAQHQADQALDVLAGAVGEPAATRISAKPDATQRQQAIQRLLSTTSGALRLLWTLESGRIDEAVQDEVVQRAAKSSNMQVRDLFERYLPEQQRTKRLGTTIDSEALLAMAGDVQRGRKVFFETAGVECKTCHRVGNAGGQVGPELTHIARRLNRRALLDAVLNPSKEIDPKFITYLVETTDGRVVRGLLQSRTRTEIVLIAEPGKPQRIATDSIELMVTQQKSLMPDLLLRELSAQQAADLLAYLESLR